MRVCAGHPSCELRFLSRFGAARGATNQKGAFLLCLHSDIMQCSSSNTMVNSDQPGSPLWLNTDKRPFQKQRGCSLRSCLKSGCLRREFSPKLRTNVASHSSGSPGNLENRQPACHSARGRVPAARAIEAIVAESNRGDRKLSSATVWHRHIHHGPVRGHIGGV